MSELNTDLVHVLGRTSNLLLDFDGPVCDIFAGIPARVVAARLTDLLRRREVAAGADFDATDDPLRVLRLTAGLGEERLTRQVAVRLRDAEVAASRTAEPTPGIDAVVTAARDTGRRLAVVSNNSVEAVSAYLRRSGLIDHFTDVVGRHDGLRPDQLKPDPHLLRRAMSSMDARPSSTAIIGDSVSDVDAAKAIPIAAIG